jgi:hypothetical protein
MVGHWTDRSSDAIAQGFASLGKVIGHGECLRIFFEPQISVSPEGTGLRQRPFLDAALLHL